MTRISALAAVLLALATVSSASPTPELALRDGGHLDRRFISKRHIGKRCTATINSASDITSANLKCTTININSFTMTAGKTLALTGLASGTTVNLLGDVTFGVSNWAGPLFEIGTSSGSGTFTFNGNGKTLDGQGAKYWDGHGSNGGKTKPHPMIRIAKGGGAFKDVNVLNTPAQAISVGNTAAMTVSGVTIDDSAGASLGANTDCFDISASDVTITGNTCKNQDDCVAINRGSNINIISNVCSGGHGVSIGSIATGKTVSGVTISDNTVTNSVNGFRIKTVKGATDASVSNVVYTGNKASGITQYGVIIEQDYENGGPTGTPSDGVTLGPVRFTGNNVIAVTSKAKQAYVLCGKKCVGMWEWSGLTVTGGVAGTSNYDNVEGYSLKSS